MRQGRWARWVLGALGGLAVVVSTTGGYNSDCGNSRGAVATQHGVSVLVQDAAQNPVEGATVTVWLIDVDQPGVERSPIVAGTALTDGGGLAHFTYTSFSAPYVCGYRVMDATSTNILADHPPATFDQLSTPSGDVTVVVP